MIENKKNKNNNKNSDNNQNSKSYILGTYFHGILDNYEFRNYLVNLVRMKKGLNLITTDNYNDTFEKNMDKLAKIIEENIDLEKIV